jgi:alpha-glucosidase
MLEDTSFALHPGNKGEAQSKGFNPIGSVQKVVEIKGGVQLQTENGQMIVLFYRSDIVRFIWNPFAKTNTKSSLALIVKPKKIDLTLTDSVENITIKTDHLIITVQKTPLVMTVSDQNGHVLLQDEKGMGHRGSKEIICYKRMDENDHFYGFGEKTGFLDKKGEKMVMWNSDVYAPHNPETDSLYESIPYFMTLRKGRAHGVFFDNTFKSAFDLRSDESAYSFMAEGGQLDYYVMAGPSPKEVLEQYTYLTGKAPIPPKWAIGYHQSRYSYETEEEVRSLVHYFKEKEIPLDVVYLDIHYMDGYRVFTFDPERFPNPKQLIDDLRKEGIRIVPIVDPGVKEDAEYKAYQDGIQGDYFCKYIEGQIYYGDVWPGNSAFPDFTDERVREWWGENHRFYTDLGIEGIWNDMNEPAVFNETKTMDLKVMHKNDGDPKTHRELHNLYGLRMGESTYEGLKKQLSGKRPFLLTRAGYSGVQRYAAVWTGDNRSFWEHLQMSLPMVMNLGLSGIPFSGPDVGGFAHDSNGELLARWTQVGAFTPYFRNHSALGFVRQEPWSFGEKYEAIVKKYIDLRYQWLPFLYTLFAEAYHTGTPIVRPLLLHYPMDEKTYQISDQFMVGDNVIVAPIMEPGGTHRAVYLPEGKWVDYWTNEVIEGSKYHLIEAPLDVLPMFIKIGSMVVLGLVRQSTEAPDQERIVHLYAQEETTSIYSLYDDDGKTFDYESNDHCITTFKAIVTESQVEVTFEQNGSYKPEWSTLTLALHGTMDNKTITVNGTSYEVESNESGIQVVNVTK